MRALVIANGEPPSAALLQSAAAEADLVIAADGGLRHALDAGIQPAAVVGDLDSLTFDLRNRLPESHFHQDTDPDTTDLQKAVQFAVTRGATEVTIMAAGGGRADHHLANLSLLTLYRGRPRITISDDLFDISLVDGSTEIEAPAGTVISLVAIGNCTGVTTTGLRWDLTSYPLTFSPYGVHNEVVSSPATVSVATGDLLLFRGRFIEHHR